MKKIWKTGLLPKLMFAGAFVVPFGEDSGWKSLTFRKIPPHQVSFSDSNIHLKVNKSANPVVYALPEPKSVSKVQVEATWSGNFVIPEGLKQGEKGADDYVLRVGLVVSGDRTLNFVEKRIAPNWIKQLHDLAPKGMGVSQIYFLNVATDKEHVGSKREHPLSDLLYEHIVDHSSASGPISFQVPFEEPKEVLGLWISSDGDDIDAQFEIKINKIHLE